MEPSPIIVVSGPSSVGKTTVATLCAATFERSVHLQGDSFLYAVVTGLIDPSSPEAAEQNDTIGGALAAAAIEYARGGYIVLVDGTLFPEGVEGFAEMCGRRGVSLHYAILRADLTTCWDRAKERGVVPEWDPFARLHDRFCDLGPYEAHVIDAQRPPQMSPRLSLQLFRPATRFRAHR